MKNRRTFIRKTCAIEASVRSYTDHGRGEVTDISLGGAGFITPVRLRQGQRIVLTPATHLTPATFLVQAVNQTADGRYRCGLKFAGSLDELLDTWLFEHLSGTEKAEFSEYFERRREQRLTLTLPLLFESRAIELENLSGGGMRLLTSTPLPRGRQLDFTLGLVHTPVRLRGRILSCRPEGDTWRCRVAFCEEGPEQQQAAQFLRSWLAQVSRTPAAKPCLALAG